LPYRYKLMQAGEQMSERIRIQRRKQISDSYSYPQLATDTSGLRMGAAQASVSHDISRISLRPQAQLTVSQPGDFYEQEADRVAQQVMGMGDRANNNAIQRSASPQEEEENLQLKSLGNTITPLVQREEIPEEEEEEEEELVQAKSLGNLVIQREEIPEEEEEEEEEKLIQAKSSLQRFDDGELAANSDISSKLHSRKGQGSPLAGDVQNFMEPRFGVDFSNVKVHTDGEAVQMSRELGAQAFTYGSDVYFSSGKSPGNNELTAHELTHVVQQTGVIQRQLGQGVSIRTGSKTPQIQKQDPVSVASLGVAVFESGRNIASSGNLYHNANTPSYMHERTPAEAAWENVVTELHVQAHHPRIGWGEQDFYYRLSYERNGYDIRNAQVDVLRDKSSGMYTSVFGSTWSGQTHSRPTETVAQIVFNISGEWNPHGRGHVSWWGQLILSASKGTSTYQSFTVGSEESWVWKV
jgi:Domain of unknown function (DUF4157)